MMLLCTNNLHSLTKWRLRCNRALNVWQVVINKGILCNVLQPLKNKLLNYTTTVHHKESTISDNILYAFEKPNTIVSLCLDLKKKKKENKPRFNLQSSFPVFWQCHAFHTKSQSSLLILLGNTNVHIMEKKQKHTGCEMSPQWCKKTNF